MVEVGGLLAYDVLWREHVSNEVDSVENIVSCVYLQYHMFGVPIYNILETLRCQKADYQQYCSISVFYHGNFPKRLFQWSAVQSRRTTIMHFVIWFGHVSLCFYLFSICSLTNSDFQILWSALLNHLLWLKLTPDHQLCFLNHKVERRLSSLQCSVFSLIIQLFFSLFCFLLCLTF